MYIQYTNVVCTLCTLYILKNQVIDLHNHMYVLLQIPTEWIDECIDYIQCRVFSIVFCMLVYTISNRNSDLIFNFSIFSDRKVNLVDALSRSTFKINENGKFHTKSVFIIFINFITVNRSVNLTVNACNFHLIYFIYQHLLYTMQFSKYFNSC